MRSAGCRFILNSSAQVRNCSTRLRATEMPGTLIIGYGNPLRGDDGLGWQVASELAKCVDALISVLAVQQLTPELAEPVSDADLVIFVDACCDGEPGSWRCESIRPGSERSGVRTLLYPGKPAWI